MSPLKVLLVVYAFPPAGGVGTLRAASLARYLPAEGIELDVLTTRNPSSVGRDESLLNDIPPEVTVHRTVTLDLPFGLKKKIKEVLNRGKRSSGRSAGQISPASNPGLISRIAQDILLPDPQITWLPILTRAAGRIVQKKGIDVVLITGAPYSTYLLAERLRRDFPRLPIVLDFRDEWVSTAFDPSSFHFSRTDRARRFAIREEAKAISSATAVVAVTEAARHAIRSRYPKDPDSKFHHIPNGFDGTRMAKAISGRMREHKDRIRVTCLGTVYSSNDPANLVTALQSLPSAVKGRLVFRFIGHIEESRYREALEQLGDMVELQGYIPQREALKALQDTDYVLLVWHDKINIAAKFYDYLGSGKPILACVHRDSDIRRLLEELRAGWWADIGNVDHIRQLFTDAAAETTSLDATFQPDRERIAQYERKPLAQRYAALLHSLARPSEAEVSSGLEALSLREV